MEEKDASLVTQMNLDASKNNATETKETDFKILAEIKDVLATKSELQIKKQQPQILEKQKTKIAKKNKSKIFGYELIMDLFDCNPEVITSKKKLQEYVDRLCKLIKMKKFGKTLIPLFGANKPHTKGYSLVQLIETSSITGHFSELWKTAYINIFSCKVYNHKLAADFTKKFFGAKRAKIRFLVR